MSKPLNALMTKLTWQYTELTNQLQVIKRHSAELNQAIEELVSTINQSSFLPQIINPEFEMNRLSFLTQEHIKKETLIKTLNDHKAQEESLNNKIQRVKTEQKMLEKYLAREHESQEIRQKTIQEKAIDEWALQKRKA